MYCYEPDKYAYQGWHAAVASILTGYVKQKLQHGLLVVDEK